MPEPAVSGGFVRLGSQRALEGRVGCLFALSGLLLFLGCGILAVFIVHPEGKGDMWVMPVVGGGFALVGAVLLYGGLRGARGRKFAPAEVSIERGVALRPGTRVRVRLRQPGAMAIESLRLKVCCERVYRRRVDQRSSATVQDREVIWEQVLLDIRDETVPAGSALERETTLALPANALPTGPARPDGRIRWQFEVWGEAGWLRATYHAFEIHLQAAANAAPALHTAGADEPSPPPFGSGTNVSTQEADTGGGKERGLSPGVGCLAIGVGFLVPGVVFIWMFFSGAASSGSGNPYMALFGGVLFSGIGLVALAAVVLSVLPSPSSARRAKSRH